MRGKKHSDAVQAEVIAALLAGQGVTEVAQKYKLPKATVSRLKNKIAPEKLEQVGTEKRESIATLIENHLSESLRAATELARKVSTDAEWFSKQGAQEIAILYGVLSDKSIRILEATESDGTPEP